MMLMEYLTRENQHKSWHLVHGYCFDKCCCSLHQFKRMIIHSSFSHGMGQSTHALSHLMSLSTFLLSNLMQYAELLIILAFQRNLLCYTDNITPIEKDKQNIADIIARHLHTKRWEINLWKSRYLPPWISQRSTGLEPIRKSFLSKRPVVAPCTACHCRSPWNL